MERDDIKQCAELLADLRSSRRTIAALPGHLRPGCEADAYDIQDELHGIVGGVSFVLKVGCTGMRAQRRLGFTTPFAARIPGRGVVGDGVRLDTSMFLHVPALEGEIAMRLGHDVAIDQPLDLRSAIGLVEAIAPAIEIVDSRFDELLGADGLSLVADNGVAAMLAIGSPVDPRPDLSGIAVALDGEGEVFATGSSDEVLGNPYLSLLWVLQHEQARGRSVAAGTWVTTGTCTGVSPCPLDTTVTATFDGLGAVSMSVADTRPRV